MNIDAQTWSVIERKAVLYDAARNEITKRIRGYVEEAIEKLRDAEAELLGAVEIEFWNNPFSELLAKRSYATESEVMSEVKSILSKEVLRDFGPGDEAFTALLSEIDAFKAQHRKVKRMLVDTTPQNLACRSVGCDTISVQWDRVEWECSYEVETESIATGEKSTYNVFENEYSISGLDPETEYRIRVRSVTDQSSSMCLWSDPITVKTGYKFSDYIWKSCPDKVDDKRKYAVDNKNPRIATKINDGGYCTIIGNKSFPLNKVVSWSIKILKSANNDGNCILIGVAPNDISQDDDDNYKECGWYFDCYRSTLRSGPPHKYGYLSNEYGPRKKKKIRYIHTGDSVGVVMNTTKGELSFVLNRVDLGVAYEGIPLDNPLVPCVLLKHEGDSVELDTSEVKENADDSIPVPSNIIAKGATCDSIDLTWNEVIDASFYQIETDGSKFLSAPTTNTFTKKELFPDTEHSFRVRTVRGSSVSKWSGAIKGKTTKRLFETSAWKECPNSVGKTRKYTIDENNTRVATKVNSGDNDYCTIIGNTLILLNTVISLRIKVLKSKDNGGGIWIGIGPNDINQNNDNNYIKCGWYFDCYSSTLISGPPHKCINKTYGPRKGWGEYVRTGDSVCVVMDTKRGNLSFVLNGVNYCVAYEGIPLDKPLVPCVILMNQGDSVEFGLSEVEEIEINDSIPVPSNVIAKDGIPWDSITLTWDKVGDISIYQIEVDGSKFLSASTTNTFTKRGFLPESEHSFRVRAVRGSSVSKWSGVVRGKTQKESFETSAWKECPDDVDLNRRYFVDENSSRFATKINGYDLCTIIGNTRFPLNIVVSWSIKILKSWYNNGWDIYIGIAPNDINQNYDANFNKCGWYFDCYYSKLCSGPPHNFWNKEYGPRKKNGQYVQTGDSVGVVMDTAKGDLSFVLNGVNLGVAYEGIPLDKPLVPCVILGHDRNSIEIDTSEVKENVDSSIPAPPNIAVESTWDSITLTWDEVSDVSFYQIEVDGSKSWDASTANTFTKRGLFPETDHSFRVRTVRGSSVSEWSDAVEGRILKAPEFSECVWKTCPDDVGWNRKYSVDEKNPRVVAMIHNNSYCTIIGNMYIPLNKVTSWSIKVLKSRDNDGSGIYIGIAPNDINQNVDNFNSCGWYFHCYYSKLFSGPPHSYSYPGKEYGPRKNKSGRYVHTGDSVGVVVDTKNGNLSFVLDGTNCGAAYKGIPLDKPLVPCVILCYQGDSLELNTPEVKENVDSSISVPPNIVVKNTAWDSITLAWDDVPDASFYQIEVDGSKSWGTSSTNSFAKRGLLPETEHSFRVRTVRGSTVSEWSDVVEGRTLKWECAWKECPDDVDEDRKYSVDGRNPRVATKINSNGYYCTIIGNTYVPLNTVTSWSIKIHKSKNNNGYNIFIGIAPFDINQNEVNYYNGWYFYCYYSKLFSGPPHGCRGKEYGPRKDYGQYVHTGDSVGVVVDTTRGDLSFVLNGVNYGVAYCGIPLNKPLVPCVLLSYQGDSVELII